MYETAFSLEATITSQDLSFSTLALFTSYIFKPLIVCKEEAFLDESIPTGIYSPPPFRYLMTESVVLSTPNIRIFFFSLCNLVKYSLTIRYIALKAKIKNMLIKNS